MAAVVAASVVEYFPSAHATHSEPASEYLPTRQFTQSEPESDPDGDDFPAAQFKHVAAVVAASVVEYFPSAHATHSEPASEYLPARQFTQSVEESDADGDDFPAAQSTHVEPASEYFPSRQFTQSEPESDPDGDDLPAAQFKHVAAVVAAVVEEYLPAAQSVQTVAPSSENLPALHW